MIKGSPSSYVTGVMEWTLTESQSNIQGRTGSNACAFIASLMVKWMKGCLLWPFVRVFPEPHFEQQQDPRDKVAHGALCDIL